MIPRVLVIAGSDSGGGAGIQADLKTFGALGVYGMAVVTALTAQNTRGVAAVHVPPPVFVAEQIDAIFTDVAVAAVKIGMLADAAVVEAVADRLGTFNAHDVVLDPVLVATSGDSLGTPGVVEAMRRALFPLAAVITPNLPEAARLAERAVDVLFDGHAIEEFEAAWVDTTNTHGTGCTLSSAIAAYLALGHELPDAVGRAKGYLTLALQASGRLRVGGGHGPVHHFHAAWPAAR